MKILPAAALALTMLLTACNTSLPRGVDVKQELGIGSALTLKQAVIGAIVLYYG